MRSIGQFLGRSASTVSREVRRNGGYDRYRAAQADERAWVCARRPKRCKLEMNLWLRRAVARKLRLNWSPEQIAGWLKTVHPKEEINQVSHETIYRSLFVQARGVLKKEPASAPSVEALEPSIQTDQQKRRRPWADQGHDLDP